MATSCSISCDTKISNTETKYTGTPLHCYKGTPLHRYTAIMSSTRRACNERVRNIEHGVLTPLVSSSSGRSRAPGTLALALALALIPQGYRGEYPNVAGANPLRSLEELSRCCVRRQLRACFTSSVILLNQQLPIKVLQNFSA